jgi:hypothetical protein
MGPSTSDRHSDKSVDPPPTKTPHYTDHIVARPERAPEAKRSAAEAALEALFGGLERFRASLRRMERPIRFAKTIPMPFAGENKPVDFVALLNDALQRADYAPAGRQAAEDMNILGYRAKWSSPDVEHFLAFSSWGRPNQFIAADVSLRHPPADAFANETMLRYLPDAYRDIYARLADWECALHFDLGGAAGWPSARLDSAKAAPAEFAKTIEATIQQVVFAKFEDVRDCAAVFELGAADEAPLRWWSWGDTRRVAMIAYLGRKLGRDSASLKSALVRHVGKFKSPPNTSAPSAEEFVDRTLAEADAALARQ